MSKKNIILVLSTLALISLLALLPYWIKGMWKDLSSSVTTTTTSSCTKVGGDTVITQFGITWTISGDKQCGQFANGDWWVKGDTSVPGGGVIITKIIPKDPNMSDDTDMHWTMINPAVSHGGHELNELRKQQGWDTRIKTLLRGTTSYNRDLNIARRLPYNVPNNSSVVSAESFVIGATYPGIPQTNDHPQMKTAAVLTVLHSVPPEGSFRPALVGTDKTIRWNKSQLNYGILRKLAPVASTPDLAEVESWHERPWIEKETSSTGRYFHPHLNYPNRDKKVDATNNGNLGTDAVGTFGRELAYTTEDALLSLQLNYTDAQKEKLYIRMVQKGIDVYGAAKNGGYWGEGGGHNQGRKMVLLLAAKALNDSDILNYANKQRSNIFQEDLQVFYVSQRDIDGPNKPTNRDVLVPYTEDDEGMAEWAILYEGEPEPKRVNKLWRASYRDVAGSATFGAMTTAVLMGLQNDWNNPVFFDYYQNRYWEIEQHNPPGATNRIQPFAYNMYKVHVRGGINPPPSPTSKTLSITKTGTGTVAGTGINCGTDCSETYAADASPLVTLTATPSSGNTFTGWSGACTGTNTTCSVTMSTSRSVTATFSSIGTPPPPPPVLVSPEISLPANNTVFPADTTSVRIEWEDMSSNYLVRYRKEGSTEVQINTYTDEHYTITNVQPGERYTFWIHTGVLVAGKWSEPKSEITFSIADDTGRVCRVWE